MYGNLNQFQNDSVSSYGDSEKTFIKSKIYSENFLKSNFITIAFLNHCFELDILQNHI